MMPFLPEICFAKSSGVILMVFLIPLIGNLDNPIASSSARITCPSDFLCPPCQQCVAPGIEDVLTPFAASATPTRIAH